MIKNPVWHPFTQHGLEAPIPQIKRAEGAALYTDDGRRIVDGISSWWVTTHGHCHPKIMAAIQDQAGKLDQMIFAGWTHEPAQSLAAALVEIMPDPLEYVFYSDSGSTSVEVALKMALGYWANIGAARHKILVMEHSYHGDTIGAMSVGERGVFNQAYSRLLFDVGQIPFPKKGHEQETLDALESFCKADNPAALIVEPLILGAGGMLIYPAWILAEMHAICARYGVIFIADEVMTGWGRTGSMLACDQANIVPDLLCLSKGITGGAVPLAVTMATAEIYDAHYSTDRTKTFYHSSSYTANPISCAAANANLAIWRDEPVQQRIDNLAARHGAALAKLADHPNIASIRQLGTIAALEMKVSDQGYLSDIGPQLLAYFTQHDLLLRPLGNIVYIMPPYCIEDADLARIYDAIADFK